MHSGWRLGVVRQDEDARRALGRRRLADRCEPQTSRRGQCILGRCFLPERDELLRGGTTRRSGRLQGRRAPRALERHHVEDSAITHAEVACADGERGAAHHAVARRRLVCGPPQLHGGRVHTHGRAHRTLERHEVVVGCQPPPCTARDERLPGRDRDPEGSRFRGRQ